MTATIFCQTPLGTMLLECDDVALTLARFVDHAESREPGASASGHPLLGRAGAALRRYFECGEIDASLPLAPAGTSFQREVWSRIARVACGETTSYLAIARALGSPSSVRAVGAATGRNPLCIFIPCHRIVASGGALTGYAWGIERKRALLAMEHDFARRRRRAA